ncbi:hypothetical protein CRUP_026213 [Coryphaenoides rupestris]|nr:hypothetical protein CRUP_026213 [Coryphaenoides rupestris]
MDMIEGSLVPKPKFSGRTEFKQELDNVVVALLAGEEQGGGAVLLLLLTGAELRGRGLDAGSDVTERAPV